MPIPDPSTIAFNIIADSKHVGGNPTIVQVNEFVMRNRISAALNDVTDDLIDAKAAIRDFLTAVDRGYFGQMPSGFAESAFVIALRDQIKS